ncbi:MAG TPA: sugar ABC transporter permease, partial [Gemmatimonadales bacterium]|nr:sugar ABC transporter permease [Gemmatimonadales bacterium]
RLAAQDATERWLDDTRLLLEEAAARVPDLRFAPPGLARVARDAAIVPADSTGPAITRRDDAGVVHATAAVRLAPGHWIELRAHPLEAATGVWLPAMLALALLGPLGARLATWAAAASPRRRRETAAAWAFLAPSALHLAVFTAGPLALAVYLSVHRVNPTEPVEPLVGIAGIVHALREPAVWAALGRTLVYAGYVPVSAALALLLALLLHGRGRRTRILLACFALPSVVSVAAIALVWRWLYQPDGGVVNTVLARVGLGAVDWLGDPHIALAAVMLVSVWTQFGAQMTVFLAGLDSIPRAYLNAARLDGGSAWHRFRRVTFPLLRPVTVVVTATGILGAGQALTLFAVLTGGGPFDATDVLVHRIYHTGWELLELGDASVLALLLSAALFGASWILLRLLARRIEYA